MNKTRTGMTDFEQQGKRAQIRYRMAYQPPYQVAHISQAEKEKRYICLGCEEEMIPRNGSIMRHHFAHKAGMERCDPKTRSTRPPRRRSARAS